MTAHPTRTCLGCRTRCPRSALLRVTLKSGDGPARLVVDEGARMGGRGAWVHPDSRCVSRALARTAFERALRAEGPVEAGALKEWRARVADTTDRPTEPREAGATLDGHAMSALR
ncbi:MAG: YlxR family protein [Micrococcales bacterium]|nr:YlxR family protein [Micrococcales bacterium]